ncbi:hypothetical protein [Qipengyuania zhejiangensis]|nr:hypothetical protein [Qipengyuania sp. Z2]
MSGKRVGVIAALAIVAVLAWAWFDGGREPLHPIEQTIELPENAR